MVRENERIQDRVRDLPKPLVVKGSNFQSKSGLPFVTSDNLSVDLQDFAKPGYVYIINGSKIHQVFSDSTGLEYIKIDENPEKQFIIASMIRGIVSAANVKKTGTDYVSSVESGNIESKSNWKENLFADGVFLEYIMGNSDHDFMAPIRSGESTTNIFFKNDAYYFMTSAEPSLEKKINRKLL